MSLQQYKIKMYCFPPGKTYCGLLGLKKIFFMGTVVALGSLLFCLIATGTCKKSELYKNLLYVRDTHQNQQQWNTSKTQWKKMLQISLLLYFTALELNKDSIFREKHGNKEKVHWKMDVCDKQSWVGLLVRRRRESEGAPDETTSSTWVPLTLHICPRLCVQSQPLPSASPYGGFIFCCMAFILWKLSYWSAILCFSFLFLAQEQPTILKTSTFWQDSPTSAGWAQISLFPMFLFWLSFRIALSSISFS